MEIRSRAHGRVNHFVGYSTPAFPRTRAEPHDGSASASISLCEDPGNPSSPEDCVIDVRDGGGGTGGGALTKMSTSLVRSSPISGSASEASPVLHVEGAAEVSHPRLGSCSGQASPPMLWPPSLCSFDLDIEQAWRPVPPPYRCHIT